MASFCYPLPGIPARPSPPTSNFDGEVEQLELRTDPTASTTMSAFNALKLSAPSARAGSGRERPSSSSSSRIDDSPRPRGLSSLPRPIKRMRLEKKTPTVAASLSQPKLRRRKISKQPSESSFTTDGADHSDLAAPSRPSLDTLGSLRSRVRELEREVRKEQAARKADAAARRAEREKAREDRKALVRKLEKALGAFEGLKKKFDGLQSQVWERQEEILRRLGGMVHGSNTGAEEQTGRRLDQIMRELGAVQTHLEKNGGELGATSTAHAGRKSQIPTPPSSAAGSQQSQGASASPAKSNRSNASVWSKTGRKATKRRDHDFTYSGSDASIGPPPTEVDAGEPPSRSARRGNETFQSIDINEFVHDDGEYTTSAEQIPLTESPSTVLTRPVNIRELHDRQLSMSGRLDGPSNSHDIFYDPVSSFEAINFRMDVTVDVLRDHHMRSSQDVPALDGEREETGAASDDSRPLPVTPPAEDPSNDSVDSDSISASDPACRFPSRLPRPTSALPVKASQSAPRLLGDESIASQRISAQGQFRTEPQDNTAAQPPSVRRGRPPRSGARTHSKTLGPGTGPSKGKSRWPRKTAYTLKGRAQEIVCDSCKGRAHWFCAGLADDEPAPEGEWVCPDCIGKAKAGIPRGMIQIAPQTVCLRSDCVIRAKKKLVREVDDKEHYYPEKIIGRRAVSRNADRSRDFQYLIKWEGWPANTSTWEPPAHFKHQNGLIDDFIRELVQMGISTIPKVNLLPEAGKYFDANTGELLGTSARGTEDQPADEPQRGTDGEQSRQTSDVHRGVRRAMSVLAVDQPLRV